MTVALVYPCALTPWLLAIFLRHLKLEIKCKSTRVAMYHTKEMPILVGYAVFYFILPYFEVFG
ncbi:uncharacterized protein BJ212DRAFT_1366123 [Suillus subaureus]|uniref:Uncharacterized protein n=1 Tax=Suillus subaureus TaxID=48587 RepID=A0A9P7JBZ2_9AGAM|nr:uncharacterized protein BJ212DRAFT_1366123 [Suillus subaureus]KAG1813617.1 hypothetical protein BJ212DRAFT_1366123 [Suillus subaureus]